MARSNKDFLGLTGFVWFQGVIEDRQDPLQIGRCRVRCIGWHTFDRSLIPTNELPWAHPLSPIGANDTITPPKEGDWCWGFFRDGEEGQQPVYVGIIPYVDTPNSQIQVLIGEESAENGADRELTLIPNDPGADPQNGANGSDGTSGGSNPSGAGGTTGNPSGGGQPAGSGALFNADGTQSAMCSADCEDNMQNDTLKKHEQMEAFCGFSITINDAIAKTGTSRERSTPGSQHFRGRALDLSTRGKSDDQKLKMVEAGKSVGFTGFGFGNTILHVDTGPARHWNYGNSRYGGVRCSRLGNYVINGGPLPTP